MSEPIVRIVPHGVEGHFETRLCPECSAFLDRLERFERQVLQLVTLASQRSRASTTAVIGATRSRPRALAGSSTRRPVGAGRNRARTGLHNSVRVFLTA